MKKVLLSLLIALFGFTGWVITVHANWTDTLLDAFEDSGDFLRETEEYMLKMQYYLRPYEEDDLNFEQWKELHGFPSSGIGPIPTGEFKLPKAEAFGSIGANTELRKFILNVVNWVLTFLGLVAIVVIIFAGYLYIVGGEENNEKSKKMILYSAIGILVILSSYAFVNTIITKTLEGGDNYSGVQSYVSVEDVIKDIQIQAQCVNGSCEEVYLLGSSGVFVKEYTDAIFYLSGDDIKTISLDLTGELYTPLKSVQWNFGDRNLYEGELDLDFPGKVQKSFTELGWNKISVMGEVEDIENPEIILPFVGQSKVLVGDLGIPKIKIKPTGNPDVGEEIEFDASASSALVGGIEDYIWECVSEVEGNCTNFLQDRWVDGEEGKQKKKFFTTFPQVGTVDVSLRLKIKYSSAPVKETRSDGDFPAKETFSVQSEETKYGDITFTYPGTILVGQEVELTASGGPEDGTYEWEGDFEADTTEGDRILASFPDSGVVAVTLKAFNSDEDQIGGDVVKNVIVASLSQPTAVILIDDAAIFEGETVTEYRVYGGTATPPITSASCDEAGGCEENANLTYTWKLNGTVVPEDYLGRLFTELGTHRVSLTVTSIANPKKTDTASCVIEVQNNLPNAEIKDVSSTAAGVEVKISASDPDGEIEQYRLVASQYGKILETQMLSGDMVVDHDNVLIIMDLASKLNSGDHQIVFRLEVTDSDGGVRSILSEKTVSILESTNNPPTVEIYVTPSTEGQIGTPFQFFTRANDPDGDKLIYTWSIQPGGYTITGRDNISHTFTDSGTFTVTVTVFDGEENVTDSINVTISEEENTAPSVSVMVLPTSGTTKTSFSFMALADDPDGDRLTYTWVFPDGTVSSGETVRHTFPEAGGYSVRVTVFDGKDTTSGSVSVSVSEP